MRGVRARTALALLAVMLASAPGPTESVAGPPPAGFNGKLEAALRNHGVKGAVLGARVVRLNDGSVIFEHNAGQPLIPASTMKMLVIAAAMDQFGGGYQFETVLARRGDDLVVIGGGDPAFGDPELAKKRGAAITSVFHEWADALKKAGVTSIRGDLLFDDSLFDGQFTHPSWPPEQHQSWYEAPIGGLNLADNCVTVLAEPTQPGKPARLRMSPGNTAMTLVNQTRSGGKQSASIQRVRGSSEIRAGGAVARAAELGEITVSDPGQYFAAALRTSLAAKGVSINGSIRRARIRGPDGGLPADLRVVARHRTPITDAAARAGKDSLGMMAEGLFKLLGAKRTGTGTWSSGAAAMEAFVQRCGASPGEFRGADGSGLSRENRVSAAAMTAVLRHMFRHRAVEPFMDSLAVAGVDGTLNKRMRDIRGRVLAKTGYVNGVRTLAGYVRTKSGEWLAFAFLYNQAASTAPLTRAQDQACRLLVDWTPDATAAGAGAGRSKSEPQR